MPKANFEHNVCVAVVCAGYVYIHDHTACCRPESRLSVQKECTLLKSYSLARIFLKWTAHMRQPQAQQSQ